MTDGLHDPLKHVDVLADGDEKRECRADIESARENSAPSDGTGKSVGGILNFVAHDGRKFEADQAKANHAEGIHHEARVGGNLKIGGGDGCAEACPDHYAQTDQDSGSYECSNGANVVDPLSHAEANNVEDCEQGKQSERCDESKSFVIGERRVA